MFSFSKSFSSQPLLACSFLMAFPLLFSGRRGTILGSSSVSRRKRKKQNVLCASTPLQIHWPHQHHPMTGHKKTPLTAPFPHSPLSSSLGILDWKISSVGLINICTFVLFHASGTYLLGVNFHITTHCEGILCKACVHCNPPMGCSLNQCKPGCRPWSQWSYGWFTLAEIWTHWFQ